eukprot:snap_masked-scaffold_30-processed-gene-0.21-mRNA-1 protein AED:1.00 eAED:1.00 QI:0/-1/0/0/-1/1/1/0/87
MDDDFSGEREREYLCSLYWLKVSKCFLPKNKVLKSNQIQRAVSANYYSDANIKFDAKLSKYISLAKAMIMMATTVKLVLSKGNLRMP